MRMRIYKEILALPSRSRTEVARFETSGGVEDSGVDDGIRTRGLQGHNLAL